MKWFKKFKWTFFLLTSLTAITSFSVLLVSCSTSKPTLPQSKYEPSATIGAIMTYDDFEKYNDKFKKNYGGELSSVLIGDVWTFYLFSENEIVFDKYTLIPETEGEHQGKYKYESSCRKGIPCEPLYLTKEELKVQLEGNIQE